jgi:hypothetical protein
MAKTRKLSPALKAWNTHWKKVRAEMEKKGTFKKGDNLTKVFKEAKKSFHHKKGGAEDATPVEEVAAPAPAPSAGKRKTKKRRASSRK